MEHLERIPNVDVDNAVLLGDSFGGYLVNWIQGNPLGRRVSTFLQYHILIVYRISINFLR